MSYRAPLADFRLILSDVVPFPELARTARFAEATQDTAAAILSEAAHLSEGVLAPLRRAGDTDPARLEDGRVRTPRGFAAGYRAIAQGGWVGMSASPAYGGQGLPQTLMFAVNEMMAASCMALHLCPLLGQGQIEALEAHASDAIKAMFLPRLICGDWTGTMNLTEPQAGSDVGALRTRAVPRGDGTYAITGQKIYISWGDHDFGGNVCHLVLARLPEAPEGTRGISLFLVPKLLPDAAGAPGAPNALRVVSLEHKLGLHGSPTAVMAYEGATGWLVGGENRGMAAMFTMMNNARVNVGVQGVAAAEGALQQALAWAAGRVQGRTPAGAGDGSILGHADVRRMLATMRAEVFAARAMALDCGVAIDMAAATGAPDWAARAALLTPIVKAHGTDIGVEAAGMGIQVHGGMGYIEETGAAQFLRDVRVTTIYEGTNGIQAMDLVGRKMMDGGAAALRLIDEMAADAAGRRGHRPDLAEAVVAAAQALRAATETLVARDPSARFAGAVPYLRAFARVLGGLYHLRAACADAARVPLAAFYIFRLMPEHGSLLVHALAGDEGLFALSDADFAA
jgi:hypothetical protein